MASALKTAISEIIVKLQSVQSGSNGPLFQLVAVHNNQIERGFTGEGYNFPMPACFIEYKPEKNETYGMGVTWCNMHWKIHIAHQQLDAGDGTMDQNLDVIDVRDKVMTAMMVKFRPSNCGNMFLVDEDQDTNHTNLYHYVIEFKCGFLDTKGSPFDSGDIITGQFSDVEVDRDDALDVPKYENDRIINQEINITK